MKKYKTLILATIVFLAIQEANAQVYAGGGFVYSQLSQSGLDDPTGFGIDIQKEFAWEGSKINFSTSLHVTVLNSNLYRPYILFMPIR